MAYLDGKDADKKAPELEPYCGSWIVSAPNFHKFETFYRKEADMFAQYGFLVETAAQYLSRINAIIKREGYP